MKPFTINQLLTASRPVDYAVNTDFTNKVMKKIITMNDHASEPAAHRTQWYRRPSFIVTLLAAVALLGGTAYATSGFTKWPSFFNVSFLGEKTDADGEQIITLSTTGCAVESHSGQLVPEKNATKYFKVPKNSAMGTEQIMKIVQAACVQPATEQHYSDIYWQLQTKDSRNANAVIGAGLTMIITALTNQSMTVQGDAGYYGDTGKASGTAYTVTYSHISPDVLVDKDRQPSTWSDLKVGDMVTLGILPNENAVYNQAEPWLTSAEGTVLYVNNQADYTDLISQYLQHQGKDFFQITPCTTNATGYCDVTAAEKLGAFDAKTYVDTAYAAYIKAAQSGNMLLSTQAQTSFKKLMTEDAAAKLAFGYTDPIICAQQVPRSYSIGAVSTNGTTANVPVTFKMESNESAWTVTVNVDTNEQKISDITCPTFDSLGSQ